MNELLSAALDAATGAGATYADVRAVTTISESLSVEGASVKALDRSESLGYGVRVLAEGAWGFAACPRAERSQVTAAARRAVEVAHASATRVSRPVELVPEPAHRATWATPVDRDPFSVALEERVSTLVACTEIMARVPRVRVARATMDLLRQDISFASSEGSVIDQMILQTGAGIEATAVGDGDVQTRSYPGSFRGHYAGGGYEIVDAMALGEHAEQIAHEAAALLDAPRCPSARTTIVLDGHQVMLQVHESVGHPTELDRVLGTEAAFAGTSFLSAADVGRLRYGSDVVNITSDGTVEGGLGTFGYDDEGVEAQRADLVRDGLLVGFQTSRDTAAAVGAERSNGAMRAEGWQNFPLIRMTNINLLPGRGSLENLLSDVDDGIYMATNKSWSIDDKRKNFQFGCEIAWEIRNGRLGRMLRDPRYTGITTEFWSSCDAVAGPEEWRVWGTPNCGKGQPVQTMRVGHGTAPARFRNVMAGFSQ